MARNCVGETTFTSPHRSLTEVSRRLQDCVCDDSGYIACEEYCSAATVSCPLALYDPTYVEACTQAIIDCAYYSDYCCACAAYYGLISCSECTS